MANDDNVGRLRKLAREAHRPWINGAADELESLGVRLQAAEAALDKIDHCTYGWSFATAVQVIDRIRIIARETLAAAPASGTATE